MNEEKQILESREELINSIVMGDNSLDEARKKKPVGLVARVLNKFGYTKIKSKTPKTFGDRINNAASHLTGIKKSPTSVTGLAKIKTKKPKSFGDRVKNAASELTGLRKLKPSKTDTTSTPKVKSSSTKKSSTKKPSWTQYVDLHPDRKKSEEVSTPVKVRKPRKSKTG